MERETCVGIFVMQIRAAKTRSSYVYENLIALEGSMLGRRRDDVSGFRAAEDGETDLAFTHSVYGRFRRGWIDGGITEEICKG